MMSLDEIINRINQHPSLTGLSMDTRINYQQLWRLSKGLNKNPTYKTLKTLSDHFQRG